MEDLSAKQFGKLFVLRKATVTQGKRTKYIVQCECGNIIEVLDYNLTNGHTQSCGCQRGKVRGDQVRKPHGEASKLQLYNRYKNRANTLDVTGTKFDLSIEQFTILTSSRCEYCDIIPSQTVANSRYNGTYIYNGIDRVDNNLGYVESNVVPCCANCNRAKGIMGAVAFREWIIRVYNKHILESSMDTYLRGKK